VSVFSNLHTLPIAFVNSGIVLQSAGSEIGVAQQVGQAMLHARLLTYLDEVVAQGSIRKAAEKLNVAASAISRQILALEEEMGLPLFDRSSRKMALTAAGELLIRHIRDTLRDQARTQQLIEQLKGLRRGLVRVGMMSGLAANIVPRAIMEFHELHPRVELNLRLMTTGDTILDAVERGDVELGLGFDFSRRSTIRVAHAAVGRLGAVVSPNHPLAREERLRLADCIGFPLVLADKTTAIRPHINQAFDTMKFDIRAVAETNSIEMMRQLAMSGDIITFLTPFDIETELRMGRLVYLPVHEFARHNQHLMVVENPHKVNSLASAFAERLGTLISSTDYSGTAAVSGLP
jgi:DNA-binding transcriptional LysR family regulator